MRTCSRCQRVLPPEVLLPDPARVFGDDVTSRTCIACNLGIGPKPKREPETPVLTGDA